LRHGAFLVGRSPHDFTVDIRLSRARVMPGWMREARRLRLNWVGLVTRPQIMWEAIRTAWAFRSHRGILPARDLIDWRLHTAYGTDDAEMSFDDLVSFLTWRRRLRRTVIRGAA
jgi:hypothetical protein